MVLGRCDSEPRSPAAGDACVSPGALSLAGGEPQAVTGMAKSAERRTRRFMPAPIGRHAEEVSSLVHFVEQPGLDTRTDVGPGLPGRAAVEPGVYEDRRGPGVENSDGDPAGSSATVP